MKKNLFLMGALVLLACCFLACKSSQFSMSAYRPVIGVGVVNVPTLAELEVSQNKVFEKFDKRVKDRNMEQSVLIENAINSAIAEMLLKKNADVLIQPVFTVDIKWGLFKPKKVTGTVSGYPATYKNFRPMTKEDAVLFKDTNFENIPNGIVFSRQDSDKKKR